MAINVSPANRHDSKGIVPVPHQLAGRDLKGTALGDESTRNRGAAHAAAANGAGWTSLAGMAGYQVVNRSWSVPSKVRVRGCKSLSCPTVSGALLPNYSERWFSGERISTAFVESTVNLVISRHFAKKQRMRWSKIGAYLLLQTRTLDGTLHDLFTCWYPAMPANDVQPAPFAAAA